MTRKQFATIHQLNHIDNALYYKKIWSHLFVNEPYNYKKAHDYLTYIKQLRIDVANILSDKEPKDIYEFFNGKSQAAQFLTYIHGTLDKNSVKESRVKLYESILKKFS